MLARVTKVLALLAFLAGTQTLAMQMPAMASADMVGTAVSMSSKDCSACGKTDMSGGACGSVCTSASAANFESPLSDPGGLAVSWKWRDDVLIDRDIPPASAPPRRF